MTTAMILPKVPMRRTLAAATTVFTALLAACADDARSPLAPSAPEAAAIVASADRAMDLAGCDRLRAPVGSKLAFHAYATGVQIYRWDGAAWAFVAPEATLFADAGGHGVVGTHYAGPTWESNSGGTVVGAVVERCTPDASAIPWLLLSATPDGPGVFQKVTAIQRLQTVGGKAPAAAGATVGEIARVPYAAEYYFYR